MIAKMILAVAVLWPLSSSIYAQKTSVRQLPEGESYVPGEVLVCPMPGQDLELASTIGIIGLEVLEEDATTGVLRVSVPVGEELVWTQLLPSMPEISYAERNGRGKGGLTPNDTHYGSQWHLRNTAQSGGTVGADIEAEAAWDLTTGSSSVVVAVLDTGIDTDHPEFVGRIDPDGRDFVNEDSNPEADHPHGTWVSGCLGANANNGFATVGVDWNCRILPIKVLNASNRGTTFDLTQGLNYVAGQADVQVICMSLINYPGSTTLRNSLRRARNAGKILIACAGNGGIGDASVSYPGASPHTISIGATRKTDARANFSGTGSRLDFVAPGESIVTARHNTSADTFSTVSGCSFATPIVSGVVGLLLALAEDRGLTLDQDAVYDLLRAGAEDQVGKASEDTPGRDSFHGHGRVNAFQSLLAIPVVLPLDVKPGSCPNPLNPTSLGVLPVALLGTQSVDITTVDVSSVLISRADGVGGAVAPGEGPPGPSSKFADVATPFSGEACGCNQLAGEGVLDLSMKFPTDEVVATLELDSLPGGSSIELVVSGTFITGGSFVSSDCVTVVPNGASSTGKTRSQGNSLSQEHQWR